jgi:hypothetical protein
VIRRHCWHAFLVTDGLLLAIIAVGWVRQTRRELHRDSPVRRGPRPEVTVVVHRMPT